MSQPENSIDITSEHKNLVLELLRRLLPGTDVWAYGSRVKGSAKPASDLDLVAFTNKDQKVAVSELREAFEESNLPFRVDFFVWDELPETFHQQIKAQYVVLQQANT